MGEFAFATLWGANKPTDDLKILREGRRKVKKKITKIRKKKKFCALCQSVCAPLSTYIENLRENNKIKEKKK